MRDCPIGTGPVGQSFTVLSEEYCKAELFLSVRDVQGSAVFFYNFLNGGDSQAVGVGILLQASMALSKVLAKTEHRVISSSFCKTVNADAEKAVNVLLRSLVILCIQKSVYNTVFTKWTVSRLYVSHKFFQVFQSFFYISVF